MSGKFNGKDRPEVIGKDAATGEDIVSTKAVLEAPGPFGAVDTLDPGLRLRVFLDAAKTFRSQYPEAPKRASELAADEVFRLRDVVQEKERDVAALLAGLRSANDTNWSLLDRQRERLRSRWFRLGRWLGFYA